MNSTQGQSICKNIFTYTYKKCWARSSTPAKKEAVEFHTHVRSPSICIDTSRNLRTLKYMDC